MITIFMQKNPTNQFNIILIFYTFNYFNYLNNFDNKIAIKSCLIK